MDSDNENSQFFKRLVNAPSAHQESLCAYITGDSKQQRGIATRDSSNLERTESEMTILGEEMRDDLV